MANKLTICGDLSASGSIYGTLDGGVNSNCGNRNTWSGSDSFNCQNLSHVVAEILYITANALSSQNIYTFSNFYLNLSLLMLIIFLFRRNFQLLAPRLLQILMQDLEMQKQHI